MLLSIGVMNLLSSIWIIRICMSQTLQFCVIILFSLSLSPPPKPPLWPLFRCGRIGWLGMIDVVNILIFKAKFANHTPKLWGCLDSTS